MKIYYSIIALISAAVLVLAISNNDTKVETVYLSHGAIERRALVNVPETNNKDELPLVLVFHGLLGNSEYTMKTYGFTELSNEKHFIVAYPEGTGELNDIFLS
ncbi:MAG: hypothetical protein ACOC80_00535 [Petrotogales bacterium]